MLQWVDKVLSPYINIWPVHVVPVLLLDSYCCHMMGSVVKINELGVEVLHIPGGFTWLCQPIDVGYHCPFKCRLPWPWEMWMLREGLVNGVVRSPTQAQVARWIVIAQIEMTMKIVKNFWHHSPYNRFEEEEWHYKINNIMNEVLKSILFIHGIFQAGCYLFTSCLVLFFIILPPFLCNEIVSAINQLISFGSELHSLQCSPYYFCIATSLIFSVFQHSTHQNHPQTKPQ